MGGGVVKVEGVVEGDEGVAEAVVVADDLTFLST